MSTPAAEDLYFIAAGAGSRHQIFPGVEICTTPGERMMLSVVTFEARLGRPGPFSSP